MTTFAETNGKIREHPERDLFYASCEAAGCTWVGPWRTTPAAAKRDAVRHHDSE